MPDDARRRPLPLPREAPPKRTLTPVEIKKKVGSFTLESTTPARNATAASFAALASVFDALSAEERIDFIELAFAFKGLPATFRKKMIEAAMMVASRRMT